MVGNIYNYIYIIYIYYIINILYITLKLILSEILFQTTINVKHLVLFF